MPKMQTKTSGKVTKTNSTTKSSGSKKKGKGKKKSEKNTLSKKDAAKKSADKSQRDRIVVHKEVSVNVCDHTSPLTVTQAKELLGWHEESENIKFGRDYIVTDEHGRKIRCSNNTSNRPIHLGNLRTLKQEHLRRRWGFNGEPLIIGRTGMILNGQHSLLSLVLAAQEWKLHPDKWVGYWKTEPTMEKLVVYGVNESDEVVNTMDTAKPRTLDEVLYRSEHFNKMKTHERLGVAKICASAVKMLWDRTGADISAHAPRRTHSESLDFIDRHPKLLDCVHHIYEEEDVKKYITPGYASAFLYLMGSAKTDNEEYSKAENPEEKMLDWSLYDKASDFWVELAGGVDGMKAVRTVLGNIIDDGDGTATWKERAALLAKAWQCYMDDTPITAKKIKLKFEVDEDESRKLVETPLFGGIDIGTSKEVEPDDVDEPKPTKTKKTKSKSTKKEKTKKDKPLKTKKAGVDWAKGDIAWVADNEDGEHFTAKLIDDPYITDTEDNEELVRVKTAKGKEWEVPVDDLSLTRPE